VRNLSDLVQGWIEWGEGGRALGRVRTGPVGAEIGRREIRAE
jgi:hypothetical protein